MIDTKAMSPFNLKNEILEIVKSEHQKSKGKCGTSVQKLMNQYSLNKIELEQILRELFDQKIITIRTGINGYMVFYKKG